MGLENFRLDLETLLPYMSRQVSFLEMLNRVKRTQQVDLLFFWWGGGGGGVKLKSTLILCYYNCEIHVFI